MCSGPTLVDRTSANAVGMSRRSPTATSRTPRIRTTPDGDVLDVGDTNERVSRSDEIKERNRDRVLPPGAEQPGLVPDTSPEAPDVAYTSPPLLGGPATIGRFSINHTRARGITALKPGFPKIGR
jgi:hypothetical protein